MPIKTYSKTTKKAKTSPVTAKVKGHESYSVPNFGGGYSLKLSPIDYLERFLILGTEGTHLNLGDVEKQLKPASANLIGLVGKDPDLVINKIKEISSQKRAISNDPAIYALALCASHPKLEVRKKALEILPDVCRTGTHLFHFAEIINGMRGWGRGLRTAISDWYNNRSWDNLVYQTLKYRQRDGWSHKDLLILSHPKFDASNLKGRNHNYNQIKETIALKNGLANYIVNRKEDSNDKATETLMNLCKNAEESKGSKQILAFMEIQSWKESEKSKEQKSRLIKLIEFASLTHEMIPTWYKNDPEVQEALLQEMPLMATIRQLNAMTASGLIAPFSSAIKIVEDRLTNAENLRKAGIHPLQVFVAQRVYDQGKGFKGQLTWKPVAKVSGILEDCFNLSFSTAPVVGKNFMFSVDVSGSMSGLFQNYPVYYCEVAACIALAMVKREPNSMAMCFSDRLHVLPYTKNTSLKEAVGMSKKHCTGSTNAGLPIEYAIKNKLPVDCFVHITDNDYNKGEHPLVLTERFRNKMNLPKTRLMSVGLTPSSYGTVGFASESDPYSMDIKGFDPTIPTIIQKFTSDSALVVPEED